jgi:uncharacterized protein (DUF1810 family)
VNDPDNLCRFVDAQTRLFDTALDEVRSGTKRGHWMWFIFPQLVGLGSSPTASFYGLASLAEAKAYLAHPLLGARLRECVEALRPWAGRRSAEQIFGPLDSMKLRSSLTLFNEVEPGGLFAGALAALFDGEADPRTLALLAPER